MLLTLKERYTLNSVLPEQGDLRTLRTIQELRTKLLPSEDEVKQFGVEVQGGSIVWPDDAVTATEIPIGELSTEIIVNSLKARDAAQTLTADHLPIWEKFITE